MGMKFKTILNGAVLFIGLWLAAYSQLSKGDRSEQVTVLPQATEQRQFER